MIGVIAPDTEKRVVQEFFEIFKTPWEFYEAQRSYAVVITTSELDSGVDARVLIVVGSARKQFDEVWGLTDNGRPVEGSELTYDGKVLPVFGEALSFGLAGVPATLQFRESSEAASLEFCENEKTIYRLGIDLFGEIAHVLTRGQPVPYAHVPTLELYRQMIREMILKAGVPVLEIPPVPGGYNFLVGLTHDVDFVWITRHALDHTLLGFLYRAVIGTLISYLRGRAPFTRVLKNWKAVLKLPLVFLRLAKDPWLQFDRYTEMEKRFGATYYFVPRKGDPGTDLWTEGRAHSKRATRYDVGDIQPIVDDLVSEGFEVGLHGIDAWHDTESAGEELGRIREIVSDQEIGVRMHWLFYCKNTPEVLESAGFDYDSTLGYNEAVGYRAGTTQVFRPLEVDRLLELPMHIQDSALFYPGRMGLRQSEAWDLVSEILDNSDVHGGAVTVNWHHRSIAPERLWDDFYVRLIEEFERRGAWIGSARQIVSWFRKRRSLAFDEVSWSGGELTVRLSSAGDCRTLPMRLRVHKPDPEADVGGRGSRNEHKYCDFFFSDCLEKKISLKLGETHRSKVI